jgi:hypothetical protein
MGHPALDDAAEMRASRLSNCLPGGKSYTPHESAIPKLLIW